MPLMKTVFPAALKCPGLGAMMKNIAVIPIVTIRILILSADEWSAIIPKRIFVLVPVQYVIWKDKDEGYKIR